MTSTNIGRWYGFGMWVNGRLMDTHSEVHFLPAGTPVYITGARPSAVPAPIPEEG